MDSKFQRRISDTAPAYVNPDPVSDINNIRLRHLTSNMPMEIISQPAHLILSTGDYQSSGNKETEPHLLPRNQHKKSHISFLIFTALAFLLYTIRAYIPENIQTWSHFWSSIKPVPITRVYTSEFRPSSTMENFLFRLTEASQTIWLIYVLSCIPRRNHLGYLYRNPKIFNSFLCFLLISALFLQSISQTPLPPEVSCICLWVSFILLIASCRLIAVKVVKYEEKFNSIDLVIIRYVVLNSLFLYTTSIGYVALCASIECIAFHLDPNVLFIPTSTTIGLSIVFTFLLLYSLLDRFVYEIEFYSIWTPYLFIASIFSCPPLRRFFSTESNVNSEHWNFYLLWTLFSVTIIVIGIRTARQILIKYRTIKYKSRRNLETQT